MKKALLTVVALGATCAFSAGGAGTASAEVVAMKTIPVAKFLGSFDMPRSQAPDHIAASEKLEGFFPAAPPVEQQKHVKERGGYQYWAVYASETEAKNYTQTGWAGNRDHDGPRTCFTTGWSHSDHLEFYQYVPAPPPKPGSKEWVEEQKRKAAQGIKPSAKPTASSKAAPASKPSTVRGIRAEKFIVGPNDSATLEVVDAWFDYTEQGVRQVAKNSVPFAKVASGPNGLTIYAARDDKQVTFIVTPPKVPEGDGPSPTALRNLANRLFAQMPNSSSTSSTECGYLRMSLSTGPGTGQMASVLATAFLPPSAEDAADLPSNKENPDEDEERRAADQRKRLVRTRPMMANVSISQLATEPDPLVSISFAWAGKDQQQRF